MLNASTYGVRVGPGGTFNTGPTSRLDSISQPGNPSFITGSPCKYLVAYGGGSGGSFSNPDQREAQQGGSGGGGGETSTPGGYGNDNSKPGSLPLYQRELPTQGYSGGPGGSLAGGGGGGAGGTGHRQASPFKIGDGGIGVAYSLFITALPQILEEHPDAPDNVPANARWFAGGGGWWCDHNR